MSTVVTENLKRSSETASRSLRGVAAAWVNFNGTGTVAIRDSQNVSSITDNGTGDYSQNFTANMGDTNFAFAGSGVVSTAMCFVSATVSAQRQASNATSSGSAIDNANISLTFDGDLA